MLVAQSHKLSLAGIGASAGAPYGSAVRPRAPLERRAAPAEPAEHDERVLRRGLPDEPRARLDLALQLGGEGVRLLPRRRPRDHVPEPPHDAVALRLEPVGQLP